MATSVATARFQRAGDQPAGLRRRYLDDAARPENRVRRDFHVPMNLNSLMEAAETTPDIEWNPSYETYRARVKRLSELHVCRPKTLPDGFPTRVEAPWAWSGNDFQESYVVQLSREDIMEIEQALQIFKECKSSMDLNTVNTRTFPLPNLEKRLAGIANVLHSGIGFTVIRGLDPRMYSALDNAIIYLGITSYIAETRGCQDSSGNMFIHVKDLGDRIPDSDMRQSPFAHNAQPFHNDVCDILAMYVQEQALSGGESHLASCATIYNEIAATRPDVIHTLADSTWVFDKHQIPAYWNTRALLFNYEGKGPAFCFSRRPITGSPTSPRSSGVPSMTEAQAEALDMVHFTAMKHKISMRLQQGDIQLVNNLAVQHARNAFEDSQFRRRHIIRLWLRNEQLAWKTPDGLKKTWYEKYGNSDRRTKATWNIFPGASRERVLFRSESCS